MIRLAGISADNRRSQSFAIFLTILSSLLYVIGYSLSKKLVISYGLTAMQVTFLRCGLVLAAGATLTAKPATGITWRRICFPARPLEQRTAAAALVASNVLSIISYSLIQVTDASALGFSAPLMLTVMSVMLLGERVPLSRWFGVIVGFVGMLLIVRPGTGSVSPVGVGTALLSALAYAIYQILVRRLRNDATSVDITLQVAVVGFIALLIFMPWMWHPLSFEGALVAVLFTAVQTAGMASIAAALRRGEASRLAPWQFFGLVWAMIIDTVAFNNLPAVTSIAGGCMILSGGLLGHRRQDKG
ncbi:DMT family transporter [Brenneria izadpanahii]|uniref:DMT family transporter n=1 Tax=Brenneria izadpanahii TaxID=2722756 RepID=A0ABX7UUW8_9GAMM|nr:DMT family transporter [Brenneria izadpanahii]QTF09180.1 DMT family transporter [Brenneria izadpanahii]